MKMLILLLSLVWTSNSSDLTAQGAWQGNVSVQQAIEEMKALLYGNPGLSQEAKVTLFVDINELTHNNGAGRVDIIDRPDSWGAAETIADGTAANGRAFIFLAGWGRNQRILINRGKLVRWIKTNMCGLDCFTNEEKDCILKYVMMALLVHEIDHTLYHGTVGTQGTITRNTMECQAYKWQLEFICSVSDEVTKFAVPAKTDPNKKCKLGYWWDEFKKGTKKFANITHKCGF